MIPEIADKIKVRSYKSNSRIIHFILINFLLSCTNAFALNSLSYSGRLVNANGSPVGENVNLKAELAYTDSLTTVRCIAIVSNVPLSNGVFHTKLDFDCDPLTLPTVLALTPANESVAIRITDISNLSNPKAYSFQSLYSVPSSIVSRMALQIAQMSATDGQVLTWDNSANKWVPRNPGGNGTVTSISAGIGLAGGVIENSGTISIANQGVETILIKDSAVTSIKIEDGTITDADISPSAEIAQTKIKDLSTNLANKENSIASGTIGQYWSWDKTWKDFSPAVRDTFLGVDYLVVPTPGPLGASDTLLDAIGKLEGQIIANDTAFDSSGQWSKSGSIIYYNTGNVGVGTSTPVEKLQVAGNLAVDGNLRLKDSGSNFVELKSPTTLSSNVTFILPSALGTNGQVLMTDASGNLSWSTPSTNSSDIIDGSIVNDDISASANIAQSKILNLTTDLAAKQASDSDLTALAGITGTGLLVRTGDGTAITRTITGTASRLNVTNGNGVAGDPVVDISTSLLPSPLVGDAGKFLKANGANISAWQALASGDITTALGFTPINKSGDSITSGVFNFNSSSVVRVLDPVGTTDVANKQYVDSQVAGATNQWAQSSGNVYRTTGYVGIGTSTPSDRLTVRATDNLTTNYPIQIMNSVDSMRTGLGAYGLSNKLGTAQNIDFIHDIGGAQIFKTAATERLRISNVGNVGIGTSSPNSLLEMASTAPILQIKDTDAVLHGAGHHNKISFLDSANATTGLVGFSTSGETMILYNYNDGGDLYLGNNGGPQLAIKNSGNIGIGTTTPGQKLSVAGTIETTSGGVKFPDGTTQITAFTGSNGSAQFDSGWQAVAGSTTYSYTHGLGTTPLKVTILAKDNSTGKVINVSSQYAYGYSTYGGLSSVTMDSNYIRIRTSADRIGAFVNDSLTTGNIDFSTSTLRVLAWSNGDGPASLWSSSGTSAYYNGGNVGIGTTTPTNKLHVAGDVAVTGDLKMAGGDSYIWTNGTGSGITGIYDSANNRVLMYTSEATGYVGIGTTTPSDKLDVNGNIAIGPRLLTGLDGANNAFWAARGTGAESGRIAYGLNANPSTGVVNSAMIRTNGVERLTINSSGLVGIGSTSPAYKLHVLGNGFFDDGASTIQLLSRPDSVLDVNNSTAAKRSFSIHHYTGSSLIAQWYNCPAGVCAQKMAFDTAGNMVIAGTLTQSSDRNLKKDIEPLENSLAKISTLKGVSYNWKDESNPEKQIGLIAQEVAKVYPEVVREDKDGLLSVGYQNLIAPIIEAIKELNNKMTSSDERYKREIASLKEQNEKLQKQNELFEKRLKALEDKK